MANPWDELEDAGSEADVEKQPWDDLEDISSNIETPEVGALEAARLAATGSSTLGLDAPVVGAAAALGQITGSEDLSPQVEQLQRLQAQLEEAKANRAARGDIVPEIPTVTPEDYQSPELLDTYYGASSDYRKLKEQAREDQPMASLAGSVVGGLPTGLALGKGIAAGTKGLAGLAKNSPRLASALSGKLGLATAEGVGFGGILGATEGDSEILRGDVENLPEEVSSAALGGAILGAGTRGVGAIAGKVGKTAGNWLKDSKLGKYITEAYDMGKSGENILSEKELLKARESAKDIASDIQGTLQKTRQNVIPKTDVRGINIKPELDSLKQNVEKFSAKVPEVMKDKEVILSKIKELDDIGVENLNSDEASQIINSIKNLTSDFGNTPSPVSKTSIELRKLIADGGKSINDRVKEVSGTTEAYSKYADISNTMKSAGLSTKGKGTYDSVVIEKEVDRLKNTMLNASNPSESATSYDKFKNFTDRLKDTMPEFYEKIAPTVKQVQDKHELIRTAQVTPMIGAGISPTKHIVASVLGYGKASPVIAANVAGRGVKASKDVLGKGMRGFVSMMPDQITDLVKGLSTNKLAAPFMSQLNSALSAEGARKSAILYSLYQQPSFRKMLEEIGNTANPLAPEEKPE